MEYLELLQQFCSFYVLQDVKREFMKMKRRRQKRFVLLTE